MADTQTYTNYAQFNTVTVTGRIFHSEVVETKNGKFLAVSVISTLSKDGQEVEFTFTNSNGLMALAGKGGLPKGRIVTLTGHITTCGETYEKNGETLLLKRPKIHMTGVQILDGGLGAIPNEGESKATNNVRKVSAKRSAPVDETPQVDELEEAMMSSY